MRRYSTVWALAVVCVVALGCADKGKGTGKGSEAAKKLDTSYIPADAVVVVVAHPAEILNAEMIKDSPIGDKLDEFEEASGMKGSDIAQVVVPIFADPKSEPAVIIRTIKPYDKDKVGGKKFAKDKRKELEHEGKKYLKSGNQAIFFADDTTMIVGTEDSVKKLMAAEKADSALIKRLSDAELHHVVVMAEVGESRKLLKALSEGAKGSPQAKDAQWAAEHIQRISLWADVSPKITLHVTIDSDDDEGGKRLAKAVDEVKTMGEGLLKLGKSTIVKSMPDGLGEKVYELGIDALANLKAEDKGKSFELTFTEPDNAKAVFADLKPMLEKMAAESKKSAIAMKSKNNLYEIGFALVDYNRDNDKWPNSLDEIKDALEDFDDAMTNPTTGDSPGYEYVRPTTDDLNKGLSKTVVLYQLRDGKRDTTLAVGYADGSVRKLDEKSKDSNNSDKDVPGDFAPPATEKP